MATRIIGKIEAIYPYDISLNEGVETAIKCSGPQGSQAIIYPPEKRENINIQNGRYLSKMRMDVTLDIDKKPVDKKLDQFFIQVFVEAAHTFLEETWLHTKLPNIDPYIPPQYVRIEYFQEDGSPFTNPETGNNYCEENHPPGIVLEKSDWEDICNNLSIGKRRDISEEWLCNARNMKYERRWDVAILLCAIACEYKVKRLCSLIMKRGEVPEELWETIVFDIRPRVMTYYEKILPRISSNSIKLPNDLKRRLNKLFTDRNKIVHTGLITTIMGNQPSADKIIRITDKHIQTTQKVIDWIDSQIANLNISPST